MLERDTQIDHEQEHEHDYERGATLRIERAHRRITMSRSGPIGKKQCLERSLRSDSPRRRHFAFSRVDFLHAQGCAVVDLVQPGFVA
jgi:hypothetical protein